MAYHKRYMSKIGEISFTKYIVAHIDLLGTSSSLCDDSKALSLLNKLNQIYSSATELCNDYSEVLKEDIAGFNIKARIFSDNICLYVKYPEGENRFITTVIFLQLLAAIQFSALLDHELLLRGGVDVGNHFENDIFVFGSTLLNAYEMESKSAMTPRILVGKTLLADFPPIREVNRETLLGFTRQDMDGNYFIEYLIFTNQKGKNRIDFLNKHKEVLIKKFNEATDYGVMIKIVASMVYHNRYCRRFYDSLDLVSEYIPALENARDCEIDIGETVRNKSISWDVDSAYGVGR